MTSNLKSAPDAQRDNAPLRDHYPQAEGLAVRKSRPRLDNHSRAYIARSPFLCIGTADAAGHADVSPRGDPAGFVQVLDDNTLLIPDRPGNNRLDTMENIVANPNVGLLFFIPGLDDTLRVNGKARIVDDTAKLAATEVNRKVPRTGIEVTVEEVFFHCAKALKRSRLWDPGRHADRAAFPSIARIILEQTCETAAGPDETVVADAVQSVEDDYTKNMY